MKLQFALGSILLSASLSTFAASDTPVTHYIYTANKLDATVSPIKLPALKITMYKDAKTVCYTADDDRAVQPHQIRTDSTPSSPCPKIDHMVIQPVSDSVTYNPKKSVTITPTYDGQKTSYEIDIVTDTPPTTKDSKIIPGSIKVGSSGPFLVSYNN